jgi:hypothetical protein
MDGLNFTHGADGVKSCIDLAHPSVNGNCNTLSLGRRSLPSYRRQGINHQQRAFECPT